MTGLHDTNAPPPAAARGANAGDARWKLVASWLVVGIPAAWGVAQVIVKSMALFR